MDNKSTENETIKAPSFLDYHSHFVNQRAFSSIQTSESASKIQKDNASAYIKSIDKLNEKIKDISTIINDEDALKKIQKELKLLCPTKIKRLIWIESILLSSIVSSAVFLFMGTGIGGPYFNMWVPALFAISSGTAITAGIPSAIFINKNLRTEYEEAAKEKLVNENKKLPFFIPRRMSKSIEREVHLKSIDLNLLLDSGEKFAKAYLDGDKSKFFQTSKKRKLKKIFKYLSRENKSKLLNDLYDIDTLKESILKYYNFFKDEQSNNRQFQKEKEETTVINQTEEVSIDNEQTNKQETTKAPSVDYDSRKTR